MVWAVHVKDRITSARSKIGFIKMIGLTSPPNPPLPAFAEAATRRQAQERGESKLFGQGVKNSILLQQSFYLWRVVNDMLRKEPCGLHNIQLASHRVFVNFAFPVIGGKPAKQVF